MPDEARSLRVAFESEASFLLEYQTNIANGGTFISSSVGFGVREPVRVEMALEYCSELIEVEVVHVVASELAGAGATPGVAVQFTMKASDIRDRFERVVGKASPRTNARRESATNSHRRKKPSSTWQAWG